MERYDSGSAEGANLMATTNHRVIADVVAFVRSAPVLVVEVKTEDLYPEATREELASALGEYGADIEFGMLVSRDRISVFRWRDRKLEEAGPVIEAAAVFSWYDNEYQEKRVSEFYLESLTVAWLDDVVNHWKHSPAPAEAALAEAGVLQRLQASPTETDIRSGVAPGK